MEKTEQSSATTTSEIDLGKPELLEIKLFPDPTLRIKCQPVVEITKEVKTLIQNMFLTMYAKHGVGLSANQVGRDKRIFVMDTSASGARRKVFINPEILEQEAVDKWQEGCLSFPGIFAQVSRPTRIKVGGLNESGEYFTEWLESIDAICFQHELDHLNGITFYDHLSQLKKSMIDKKIRKLKNVN